MTRPVEDLIVASQYGATGSSTRVRIYDWLDHLGVDASDRFEYRGAGSNAPAVLLRHPRRTIRAEAAARKLPATAKGRRVILSRELSPLSSGRTESRLLRSATHGVYDFDDALYAPIPGSLVSRLHSRASLWRGAVSSADVVLAGSEILAERAADHNTNVIVMPSCVEPSRYSQKNDYEFHGAPTAVWIGSPATEPYLQVAAPALLEEHRASGLRLTVISRGQNSLGELDRMVDRVDWTESTFASALATADFGIMPLPDDEWTRGKCAYKLLQYAATALPTIGSGVGANRGALARLGGASAGDASQWRDLLADLVRSTPSERATLGATAFRGVQLHYSFEAWAKQWQRAVLPPQVERFRAGHSSPG